MLSEIVSGLPERGDVSIPPFIVGAPRRGFFSVLHFNANSLTGFTGFFRILM